MGYLELKKCYEKLFRQADIELADFDWIICEITGKKRSEIPLIKNFSKEQEEKIVVALKTRLSHIPIDIIFGKTEFYGRTFKVSEAVLSPRMDTEVLVDFVINKIKKRLKLGQDAKDFTVLDIGTGSGIIAISIQKETGVSVVASDLSKEALEIAQQNAKLNSAEIEFVCSDLFDNLVSRKFDLIVSNPPYIETDVIKTLDDEVKNFDPILALDGGKDGLNFYRKIISEAPKYLKDNGEIAFEIGYNQKDAVCKLLSINFKEIETIKDFGGNDRVIYAKLENKR